MHAKSYLMPSIGYAETLSGAICKKGNTMMAVAWVIGERMLAPILS